MVKEIIISKKKNFDCKDELYCNWYNCTNCGNSYIRLNDNYCSHCGSELKWEE